MDDRHIVELFEQRDTAAIREIQDAYGRQLTAIAMAVLSDPQDAEECVNDTWLGAWKSMPPRRPNRLATFLGKITRNLSLNRFKQYAAEKRGGGQTELVLSELEDCIPAPATVDRIVEEDALVDSLNRFLYAQPERKRNIFIRRYWYLCSIRNIAEAYGVSESKIASALFRMRNELKEHLEREGIAL